MDHNLWSYVVLIVLLVSTGIIVLSKMS